MQIPEEYVPLVHRYMSGVQGGAREVSSAQMTASRVLQLLHLIAIGTHKIMSGDYDKTVRGFQRRQEGSSIYRRAVGREVADSSYSFLPAYDKRAARP